MINKDDEEKAFKIAMHTELEWQKLKARIDSDKKNTESIEKLTKKGIYKWFDCKPLSLEVAYFNWRPIFLVIVYTIVVVMTTIKMTPIMVPIEDDITYLKPKSSNIRITQNSCPSGYTLIDTEGNKQAKQESLKMKIDLEHFNVKVNELEKINNTAYLLEVFLPETLSQELLNFWSTDNDINVVLIPNCKMKLVFIAHTK
ncbi:hypothetical protein QUF50_00940 [Thiotrichales bacterium HSG1]|nr:hypothetical protein [Thiotrichales bacterium HSG1]